MVVVVRFGREWFGLFSVVVRVMDEVWVLFDGFGDFLLIDRWLEG